MPIFLFAEVGTLSKIIDGDTIDFNKKTRCRLAYIDTPESAINKRLKSKLKHCSGITAENMIEAGKISKEFISEQLKIGKLYKFDIISKDWHERNVCVVYKNNKSINDLLIEEGYAVPYYEYIPKSLKSHYANKHKEAKRLKKGLHKYKQSVMKCLDS